MRLQLPVLKAAKLTEITGKAAAQGNLEQVTQLDMTELLASC